MTETQSVSHGLDMEYFETLRSTINARLERIGTRDALRQMREFPWLYGALGQVPSDVMFVCENPSLAGVEKADTRTIGGGSASIEDQWCGGTGSNCIKRFRPALCHLGLKTTAPLEPGGWHCYITNVIKEAAVVRKFNELKFSEKAQIAVEWADILHWEIEQVSPRTIFTVGSSATRLLRMLRERNLLPPGIPTHGIMHYSNRGSGITDDVVRETIIHDIAGGLN